MKQLIAQMPLPGLESSETGAFLGLFQDALAKQLVEGGGLGLAAPDRGGNRPSAAAVVSVGVQGHLRVRDAVGPDSTGSSASTTGSTWQQSSGRRDPRRARRGGPVCRRGPGLREPGDGRPRGRPGEPVCALCAAVGARRAGGGRRRGNRHRRVDGTEHWASPPLRGPQGRDPGGPGGAGGARPALIRSAAAFFGVSSASDGGGWRIEAEVMDLVPPVFRHRRRGGRSVRPEVRHRRSVGSTHSRRRSSPRERGFPYPMGRLRPRRAMGRPARRRGGNLEAEQGDHRMDRCPDIDDRVSAMSTRVQLGGVRFVQVAAPARTEHPPTACIERLIREFPARPDDGCPVEGDVVDVHIRPGREAARRRMSSWRTSRLDLPTGRVPTSSCRSSGPDLISGRR